MRGPSEGVEDPKDPGAAEAPLRSETFPSHADRGKMQEGRS